MTHRDKVLVAEDDDSLRMLLTNRLEEEGFDVQSTSDGDEAIEMIRLFAGQGEKFDVILLDIFMPKVDGFQVLRYVKNQAPGPRVIMATAYADAQKAIEALRLGACDFIVKPYELDKVLLAIYRALKNKNLDAQPVKQSPKSGFRQDNRGDDGLKYKA